MPSNRIGCLPIARTASLRALVLALLAVPALGQTVAATSNGNKGASDELQEVVVTGSLIPQAKIETFTPVSVITSEDIQIRGFASVAEALQRASFATGGVEGPQYTGGFTPGAQTLSLFGLSPSYTKYLIDGRPIADYPALYNGTDIIASVSGIPTVLVDHIDVLPGGQSSIYGSDAIAGVVNVVMKKKFDGPAVDLRYGWDDHGGGTEKRIGIGDSFTFGNFTVTVGGQYDKTAPIWANKRALTATPPANGTSPQTADRDFLVFGYFGPNGDGSNAYYSEDPANCANLSGLNVQKYSRADRGAYCGTMNTGTYAVDNGEESTQGYLHATYDINDNVQLFSDILINHDVTRASSGPIFFGSADDPTSPFYYYEDPRPQGHDDFLNIQRIFTPAEVGGLDNTLNKNTNNGIRATLGVQGGFGASNWKYDVDMTFTENKLTELQNLGNTQAINNFFVNLLGVNTDTYDAANASYVLEPNYANLYKPITPAQYASFTYQAASYSRTEESLARALLTNSHLFTLPGGDAGIAVMAEGGRQGWDYQPDPSYFDGTAYLFTATAGDGHRSRYAGTTELKLPVLKTVTIDLSGRYDDYLVQNGDFNKGTYNIGIEFRPVESFLVRARYGTAFKAPTLSDEFQGRSGYFTPLTDYYTCDLHGYTGVNLAKCPQAQASTAGFTSGTPSLKPINAKVAGIGAVWSPIAHSAVTIDYLHWKISDEVTQQSADQLLRVEADCLEGKRDVNSPNCQAALSQVDRDSSGNLLSVFTPKINVSEEVVDALSVSMNYDWNAGRAGQFLFSAAYTDLLKHTLVQYAGDPVDDLFNDPVYNQDFKSKENLSVTWNFHDFGATAYVEHYGHTPNYLAIINGYNTPGAGRLSDWTLVNLSARYQLLPGLTASLNVNNVFDRMPPVDNSFPGYLVANYNSYNGFDYNVYGRTYFVGLNYRYGGDR